MTEARQLPRAMYDQIKGATRRLIARAGGLENAAAETRIARSQLGNCQNLHHDQFLPIDVVADLEALNDEPIVSGLLHQLAREGRRPVPDVVMDVPRALRMADQSLSAVSGMIQAIHTGCLDGSVDPQDRADWTRRIDDLTALLQEMRGELVTERIE